jgi:tellurite resistance protein TerC
LYQTFFWVGLAMAFFIFLLLKNGHTTALEYLSAYLMEWSLSIDNIFVFILIFSAFSVKEKNYGRCVVNRDFNGYCIQNFVYYSRSGIG